MKWLYGYIFHIRGRETWEQVFLGYIELPNVLEKREIKKKISPKNAF